MPRRGKLPKADPVPPVLFELTKQEREDQAVMRRMVRHRKMTKRLQRQRTKERLAHNSARPILQKNPNESDERSEHFNLKGVGYEKL